MERHVRDWAEENGEIYVITVAVFDENDDGVRDDDSQAARMGPGNRVAVPTHFYKIVVRELPNQRIDAMSIFLEHVDSSPSGGSAQDALMVSGFTSLANLEALTGYDFFPDFDEDATGRPFPPLERGFSRDAPWYIGRAPGRTTMTQTSSSHHRIVIVGGGTAGITVAARLRRKGLAADIAIIEPSKKHYYQPAWTLVGGGVYSREATERPEASVIPPGVTWIRDAVTEVRPDENCVLTRDGGRTQYDFLVMAPGIQIDWGKIPGLEESVGKDGVCSNFSYDTAGSTWRFIREFQGGKAIFTQPNTPIKCAGAPQKIMYMADHHFRKRGIRERTEITFGTGIAVMLGAKYYGDVLAEVAADRGIDVRFKHDLTQIRPESREALFHDIDNDKEVVLSYDLIHVTPPMSAPDFLKGSALANPAGFVDVDQQTLRHQRFPNVFALGDASSLPTSKTAAGVRAQAPILVEHLMAALEGSSAASRYDGYTSCPVVTGYGKLIMAEFDYEGNPKETFPFDQRKERLSMYLVKKYLLPRMYWSGMLKGRW